MMAATTDETCIASLVKDASARLAQVSDSPRLDAEMLLAHVLGQPRSYLYTWPERVLNPDQIQKFSAWLNRRLSGEPVAYLTGQREFWSLDFQVTSATLIPRPETERLVELALERIPDNRPLRIADLGTGSGAVALAVAQERPRTQIIATDISPDALAIARCNARSFGVTNVTFRQGDWYEALGEERFDLILSNPPYITTNDSHLRELRFEPPLALLSGPQGLDAIRRIISQASDHLYPGGWLLLEHGFDQGEAVCALLQVHGFSQVADHRDSAGLGRVGSGCWPGDQHHLAPSIYVSTCYEDGY